MVPDPVVREVACDGSPASVSALVDALAAALDGGPPVLPHASSAGPAPLGGRPGTGWIDGTALVIETSGSTGDAKRVALGSAALRASARATHRRLGGPGRWLLALPAHHVAGAQVIVRALLAGRPPWVLDNRDGFRPERFAAAAAEARAAASGSRCYTSLVPTQLHRVLAADGYHGRAALDAARGFDAVLVGGAATPPALLAEARAAGIAVVTTYGMSETAGGCVYNGVPLDGARVRLDPGPGGSGRDTAGRISLAGPMLASGYLGQPQATAEAFVDGWFRTSDLGLWVDGRLRVLGRADDVITTGGVKVHPAAVERVLLAQPGVRAACVVGLPDPEWGQLVAAAVVLDPSPPALADLDAAVRTELGAPSVPKLLRVLPELPLRGIGKPDRTEVACLLGTQP
ncbi:MAG: o-succinylbenzoate--CoA ligase [Pseudonocardia sp.]|nr:o-succinylbenzoate--CoA ligase [Pseudonocardia sp.]MBO0874236.1 o-succinylbenzoate--CoA ligase [Pseudonocardia sp.]